MNQRLILEGSGYFREKRVSDVRDDKTEKRTSATSEITSGLILGIAQILNRSENTLTSMVARGPRAIEDVRNGCGGDAGFFSHIFDADAQMIFLRKPRNSLNV